MARVTCLGAAETVTGSNFLLETQDGRKHLVDCGLFQGGREVERFNWTDWGYDPREIQALFLTHAHIDHSGRIPKLVKDGFQGPIYTTGPTAELCGIMLEDSAHIQEMEAQWQSRKRKRQGRGEVEPLYTVEDAKACLDFFSAVERDSWIELGGGLSVRFRNAGHILGSSILEMRMQGEEPMGIVFTGDIGQRDQLIVKDPETVSQADYVFMESTYGNRLHRSFEESRQELLEAIQSSASKGEKVLIPAFAVERTQEIIYLLGEFQRAGELPDIPIYLDSPLAIKATEIFRKSRESFDEKAQAIVQQGFDPLDMDNLRFTPSTQESMAINEEKGPAIVIAGNGMCTAGRIKHHLKHNLWREGASLVIVGFQAAGTTGRKLAEGSSQVRIFGEDISVRARVYTIGGFSAHADQKDLLDWVGSISTSPHIFLVHGERAASDILAEKIRSQLGFNVSVPRFRERLTLKPRETVPEGALPVTEGVDVMTQAHNRLVDLEKSLKELKKRVDSRELEMRLGEEELDRLEGVQAELDALLRL